MKELEQQVQDKTEVAAVAPVATEKKLLGRIKYHKGHTFWELDYQTGEIRKAEVKWTARPDGSVSGKVDVKPGNYYASALNEKNARKHFIRLIGRQYLIQQSLKQLANETNREQGVSGGEHGAEEQL